MAAKLALIDKKDNFELVLDQIAAILVVESAEQKTQAQNAGKTDPELWDLRVYKERSNPFEDFLNGDQVDDLPVPVVNIRYDTTNYEMAKSNVVKEQVGRSTFVIDCIGGGIAQSTAGGHDPGDLRAAESAHRALRLCRNILMAAEYTYLGMRGVVGRRWSESIQKFQPVGGDNQPIKNICGARFTLAVEHSEQSPQIAGSTLNLLSVNVEEGRDGLVTLARADYDYT